MRNANQEEEGPEIMRKLPCGMKAILIFIMLALSSSATAITLAENGRSDYQIVVPNKRPPVTDYAAKELQHFLREISGVELPIVTENKAGSGPAILLGKCRRVKNVDTSKLKADGVLIESIGEDIVLLGQNERGQLYSVYVLLERFMGVRFLAHDCTIIPKKRAVTLPKLDYSYSPPFTYRETLSWDSFPKEIAARQRLNGPYTKCDASTGGKIAFHPYVHSFNLLVPPEKYFKDHPEYYSLIGGKRTTGAVHAQLCLTNPDVLRIATEQVLKWIEEHPDVPIIDVSQNDGNGWCECEKCTAIANEEGSQHGPIMRFVNAIAEVVAEKYPDKWIETLAYAYSTKPPALTKPRKNVIIRLCHAGCYYHGFTSCGLGADFGANLKEWSGLTDRIFIWHYGTNFAHYIAPNQNLNGLARDILVYSNHGVNGVMVQCDYQGPGGELAELRQYLASQLLWDPKRHPREIRLEFCRGYYGPAADDVLQFLTLMDKLSDDRSKHAFGAWDPKDTVPPSFVAEGLEILNRAKSRTTNPQIVNRIEKLMLPLWYMQLTYAEIYALDEEYAPSLVKSFERVASANGISYINEGRQMQDWLDEMKRRFPT